MFTHYTDYDHTGQTFGQLQVLSFAISNKWGERYWHCRCSCGAVLEVSGSSLREGKTISCGCFRRNMTRLRKRTHGESASGGHLSSEYIVWSGMKQRCLNPKNTKYSLYGGRGIKICDQWVDSFERFLQDMGRRPSLKHSLDRIDVNGDYESNNCRWATHKEQAANKRTVSEVWSELCELQRKLKLYEAKYGLLTELDAQEVRVPHT